MFNVTVIKNTVVTTASSTDKETVHLTMLYFYLMSQIVFKADVIRGNKHGLELMAFRHSDTGHVRISGISHKQNRKEALV